MPHCETVCAGIKLLELQTLRGIYRAKMWMSCFMQQLCLHESMVILVLRQYLRGENGTEFSGVFFFKRRSAMALWSVLLIQIGIQNVKIIEK